MKLLTSITAVLAGLTLTAQDYDFTIVVARNQSVTTAFNLGMMHINFNSFGSHYTDGMDATEFILDSSFVRPYTTDSAGMDLMTTDSRPHIYSTLHVPFGIWSNSSDEIFIQGTWINPGAANLFDVALIDNASGIAYNMYIENNFSLPADVAFNNQFTIVFTPKAWVLTFDESCFGHANGSAYIQSPEPDWEMDVYRNTVLQNSYTIAGRDTFLQNLATGNYTFVYKLNNAPVDTVNSVVSGPAQIIASYNVSNSTPEENEPVSFTNTSTGAFDFVWDFGDGNTSMATSPTHTYTTTGFYAVTLTAYTTTGCSSTSTTPVNVVPATNPSRVIGRGSDMTHETAREAAATVESRDGLAHISSANEIAITQLTIYSVTGQLIYSGTGNENTFSYEVSGIYLAQIVYADGQQELKKVSLN